MSGLTRFLIIGSLAVATATAEVRSYVIDLAAKRQVIDHFGANDAWSLQKIGAWSDANKNRIADLLYTTDKGIGLSFCRFYVGAGINLKTISDDWRTAETFETAEGSYDWNRLANERWFLRAAKARGVQHFGMTFYSPPPRLTRNGLTNHGADRTSSTNLKPGGEKSFAGCMADILARYRDHPDEAERIQFDRVFPINEPQWEWQKAQEGCRYSNEDTLRLHLALQAELSERKLRSLIGGPESGSIPDMTGPSQKAEDRWKVKYGDYLRFFGDDPQLAKGLGGVMTYHSYWSDSLDNQLVQDREVLGKALAARPDWKLWQSEYCVMEGGRDLTMKTALRVARVIHCDLTIVGASSWQWWLAVANENFKSGLIYTDYKKPGDAENILESKILWALGNYSRYIRPGMRRVDVRGGPQDIRGLMTSAYLDADHKRVVVVCVNVSDKAETVKFALSRGGNISSAAIRFASHMTSDRHNLAAGPVIDGQVGGEVPPLSVVTFVSQP